MVFPILRSSVSCNELSFFRSGDHSLNECLFVLVTSPWRRDIEQLSLPPGTVDAVRFVVELWMVIEQHPLSPPFSLPLLR